MWYNLIKTYTAVIISGNWFNRCLHDVLTVTAHEGVGHGLVAAVGQSPVTPAVGTLSCGLVALVPLALPRADANDTVHQLALGLLLLQVVVLSDAVDELADLVGLAGERGVGRALGQLVDLVQGVQLQQLLGDEGVDVRARVAQVVQVVVLAGEQAGVADRPVAFPFTGRTGPFWGGDRVPYCLTRDAHIRVAEAVTRGQLGGLGGLAGLQGNATGGVAHGHAIRRVRLAARFRGMVCGALVNRQTGLSAAIKSTGQYAADKSLAAAPAHRGTGATGMSGAGRVVCGPGDKSDSLRAPCRAVPWVASAATVLVL